MKKINACFIAVCFLFVEGKAQSLNSESIKEQMVKDWERAKEYTLEYLNTMPPDQYIYKPNPDVRNFAGHMLHLASINAYFMSVANDLKSPTWLSRELQNRTSAQNKDSVMYYVTASYDFAINAVKNSDANKWGEIKKIKFGSEVSLTRFALMNKAFEHQTHHRGQTTIYIRMLGIKPPNEKLF